MAPGGDATSYFLYLESVYYKKKQKIRKGKIYKLATFLEKKTKQAWENIYMRLKGERKTFSAVAEGILMQFSIRINSVIFRAGKYDCSFRKRLPIVTFKKI